MSPHRRKKSQLRPIIKWLRIQWMYKQGARARRANVKTLYALMDEISGIETRRVDYQPHEPHIIALEKFLPFEGSIVRGDRSSQDYKGSWTCICGTENGPSKRRLFDIPALRCRSCSREADDDLDFDFVYERTLLNGINAIREIRQQTDWNCAPYAWTSAAEIDQAIEIALEGKTESDVDPEPLVPADLIKKHKMYRKLIRKSNGRLKDFYLDVSDDVYDMDALELLGAIVKVRGIRQKGTRKAHKIDSPMKLDKNDFAEICTAIADGPVVATFRPGVNCADLAYGQVYKATDNQKFLSGNYKADNHAVILVGAGRRKGKRYFHFLNSWDKGFCCRISKKEKNFPGGIGMIRAKDLSSDPIHLRRKTKVYTRMRTRRC